MIEKISPVVPKVETEKSIPLDNLTEPKFELPSSQLLYEQFASEYPELREVIQLVLQEVDRQALESFATYKSESFPGVAFSHATVELNPAFVESLQGRYAGQKKDEGPDETDGGESVGTSTGLRRVDYVQFQTFYPPPGGHALSTYDMIVDRFVRLMPQVIRAIKAGEQPPHIAIHAVGGPTGVGGTVDRKWLENVQENGFDVYGQLYAEFIQDNIKETDHLVLQGVSKGSVVAERTSQYVSPEVLSPESREKHGAIQVLMDNPAGHHGNEDPDRRATRGVQVLRGFLQETAVQWLKSSRFRTLLREESSFSKKIAAEKGFADESTEQLNLKRGLAITEIHELFKGTPMNTEARTFLRNGTKDPLTFSIARWRELLTKEIKRKVKGKNRGLGYAFASSKGRLTEGMYSGSHFFTIYRGYKRWAQILKYAKGEESETKPLA